MNKPKWSAEKHAWADGAMLEQRLPHAWNTQHQEWHPFDGHWRLNLDWEYRIKPEPKPDQITDAKIYMSRGFLEMRIGADDGNIQIVVDGANVLQSVRMIGKPDPERIEALLRVVLDEDISLDTRAEIKEALRTD